MTIRTTIASLIEGDGTSDEKARLICGYLSCECGLDNGNGWYDDDPEMSLDEDIDLDENPDAESGLSVAEGEWLKRVGKL